MKIEREPVNRPVSIEEFAEKYDLTMVIRHTQLYRHSLASNDRITWTDVQFLAHIKDAETKEGPILSGRCGYGLTEPAAIDDYARHISGKLLVIDAYGPARREIQVPMLINPTRDTFQGKD